jgi:hypothetical protein
MTELILESDSEAHSLEDEDTSAQSDTGNTTDKTDCPTVPVVHKFTGGPRGLRQT